MQSDEQAIRDALGRKLHREGFEVVLCGDGLEGLRGFHAERPDVWRESRMSLRYEGVKGGEDGTEARRLFAV